MKNNLTRLAILAPVLILVVVIISKEAAKQPTTQVLGSSIIITVGDSGITCTTKALVNNEQTGQLVEIDGVNLKGAPLGGIITYQTNCQNSGSTTLSNINLTNNLNGQNQNYLTYQATGDADCAYQNNIFSCVISTLASGGTFTRSFSMTVTPEVPTTLVVSNVTQITAAETSGSTTNDFSIFARPICTALTPTQNPIIVVENTPVTLTASGTTFDSSAPIYIVDFGDGSNVARQTASNFVHTYARVAGETESTYFTYLKVSDSVGNTTGDAANCSADCSKIVKVIGTLAPKYCACVNNAPSCSATSGSLTCSQDSECSTSCTFYCDQAAQTVTPSTGKSPLTVGLSITAGGSPTLPLTVKIFDGVSLIKQETSSSNSFSTIFTLTNSLQTVQTHVLTTSITDATGKAATNSCVGSVAVQPGASGGHYECQNTSCVYSTVPGQNTCTSNTDCQESYHLACNTQTKVCESVAGAGANTCTSNASCQGTTNPPPDSTSSAAVHLECNATTKVCEAVEGMGSSTCQTNTECVGKTGPAHFVCNKVRKTCESYYGSGPNSCLNDAGCRGLRNGFTLPTIIVTLLGSSLLLFGLVSIIKLRKN